MENTFGKNIIPSNEKQRLKAIHRYKLLDNLPAGYFNNLAQIIATTFNTPIALVSLVAADKVLFPGNLGMAETTEVPRGTSLCSLGILDEKPTVFSDALKEPCLLANPLVSGEFGLRFYAGAPVSTPDGYNIGTVCVVDKEPRNFTDKEKRMLQQFANSAMQEIEMRLLLLKQVEKVV